MRGNSMRVEWWEFWTVELIQAFETPSFDKILQWYQNRGDHHTTYVRTTQPAYKMGGLFSCNFREPRSNFSKRKTKCRHFESDHRSDFLLFCIMYLVLPYLEKSVEWTTKRTWAARTLRRRMLRYKRHSRAEWSLSADSVSYLSSLGITERCPFE